MDNLVELRSPFERAFRLLERPDFFSGARRLRLLRASAGNNDCCTIGLADSIASRCLQRVFIDVVDTERLRHISSASKYFVPLVALIDRWLNDCVAPGWSSRD